MNGISVAIDLDGTLSNCRRRYWIKSPFFSPMLTVAPSLLHRPHESRWTGTVPLLVSVSWSKRAEVACC